MHTQPLHLLTFKCTMFPRSPCDSGDCICGLPAAGSLSLAFTLAQSLMWSDQTLMTHIPSSASGQTETQGTWEIGVCTLVFVWVCVGINICLTKWRKTEKVRQWLKNDTILSVTSVHLITLIAKWLFRRIALLTSLCAWFLNHSSCSTGLAHDDWTQ